MGLQIEVQMPALHPGQREVARSRARFKVLACGRRWGKTRLAAAMCVAEALNGGHCWWVAPTYKIARIGWRLITRMLRQIPGVPRPNDSDMIARVPGGGIVEARSAEDYDNLRGEGLDFLVLDECAFIREEAWTQALRPALSDRLGRAVFISTPKGRNWFYRLYEQATDGGQLMQAWKFPTETNPFIPREEIELARQSLPERVFLQEYMAEFLDDAGGVFRGVLQVVDAGRTQSEPYDPKRTYVAGVDLARLYDFTVICVLDDTGKQVHFDRFNRISWERQRQIIADVYRKYRSPVFLDSTGVGDPIWQDLLRMGVPVRGVRFSHTTKEQIIDNLAMLIERGAIRLMDISQQTTELQAFQYEPLPSGRLRMTAPEGLHDDCVTALALAACGLGASQIQYTPFDL